MGICRRNLLACLVPLASIMSVPFTMCSSGATAVIISFLTDPTGKKITLDVLSQLDGRRAHTLPE